MMDPFLGMMGVVAMVGMVAGGLKLLDYFLKGEWKKKPPQEVVAPYDLEGNFQTQGRYGPGRLAHHGYDDLIEDEPPVDIFAFRDRR